ncbi:MAG: NlpC/P60 family protein [Hyphomicrobium sp.]
MTDTETQSSLTSLDPRRNAFRPDLAAKWLEGKVMAQTFVAGAPGQITRGAAPLRKGKDVSSGFETEALFGETLDIFEEVDGWAWVQLARDGYVGYMPADALSRNVTTPTHRVQALGTFLYAEADIKSPPLMHLPMNAVLTAVDDVDRFIELQNGGFVISRHAAPLDRTARDYAEIAERFVGSPYLWGGRTRIGIDCSGLVQAALQAAGLACPRDSDMQRAELGQLQPISDEYDGLERGDLVFWPGHVGMMLDGVMMVHANAHHMAVVVEPASAAAVRIARDGGQILAVKRIGALGA